MSEKKATVIAFYLPQFHPIPENDEWWGKGFTEWTNVGKAKPLFPGHYQPRIPADLGYYDLRLPEVREAQAELAKEAGVDAFCYWHYWFSGKQLLEKPLQEVVRLGKPDFPFCLAWANHSWEKRSWNSSYNQLSLTTLIDQTYGDEKEIVDHFYAMLPMFQDRRYFKINNKLLFYFYAPESIPCEYFKMFLKIWQQLALDNELPGFYWIAKIIKTKDLEHENVKLCNAYNYCPNLRGGNNALIRRTKRMFSTILKIPLFLNQYKTMCYSWVNGISEKNNVYPTILSGFDHSPRAGASGTILVNYTPNEFQKHVEKILDQLKNKDSANRIIFLKSWNEWAEGNYMEPDLKYGKQFIEVLKNTLTHN